MKTLSVRSALMLSFGLVLGVSSLASAQGEIRGVRTSKNPQFDRLVFDLGSSPVDVAAVDGDRYVVEFQATPPSVDFATEDKLSSLGVKIERGSSGTRVAVDRRGRNVQVFKLPGSSASSSGRVVLDIGKQGATLSIPPDAGLVATRSAAPTSDPVAATPPPPAQVPVLGGDTPPVPPATGIGASQSIGGGSSPSVGAAPSAPSNAGSEEVWVSVRAIDFEGVSAEAPSRDDLLNLDLDVSVAENGDLVAPRTDLPVQKLTLRSLTADDRQRSRIGGSLLQQIVERIADEYEERGKYGTRIDISKRDLERLLKDQDGRLVIRISETSEAGAGAGNS